MFIDHASIYVKAGDGGSGVISFRREKYVPKGGPDGGDGGDGGSVILVVDSNIRTLLDFKYQREYKAKNGEAGKGNNKTGKSADDIIIRVPPGTIVFNEDTAEMLADMTEPGQKFLAAKGGDGGRGNSHFSTPTNRTPRHYEHGWPGPEMNLRLELKLIADVGLIGLPNAGKSTLLSCISAAKPKIADYPFTTLEPMLGVVYIGEGQHYVVADIPGLIEGASDGRGLGHEFLRHVERTKILLHLVDISSEDPKTDYKTIRKELAAYSEELAEKPIYLVWTKNDLRQPGQKLPRLKTELPPISAVTGEGMKELKFFLHERLAEFQDESTDYDHQPD